MNCLRSLSESSVELTVYQGQLHLVTFLRGHFSANLCVPRVCIHGSTQCAVEEAPMGSHSPPFFFFFFFFLEKKRDEVSYELNGEFGLECFNKPEMDNFD